MDVVTAITRDHRLIESLIDDLAEGGRPWLLTELKARIAAHAAGEDHVYGTAYHGAHERDETVETIAAAERAEGTERYAEALAECAATLREHVDEEERDVLPRLAKAVPEERLEDLGRAFEDGRAAELRRSGVEPG
ncbi:hypothetical protein Afil01_24320 [Actinorhabdospora filicis]|uniref:Hemerythrin HHE cation binding domain-containing protein n=1 Tax=Actinorhabdospora filicis TaxID=1785913 RepID=A0A9W6SKL2_9ACTN|nr:hypothetical protein [Actinorhabdospora filicis]GLZ77625.1 hypothetical protein Afil01_24320 [Actinorhabdospora filicis]